MIPILILYIIRKFKGSPSKLLLLFRFKSFIKKAIAMLCLLVFTSKYDCNQTGSIAFNIQSNSTYKLEKERIIKNDMNHCTYKLSILI